MAKKHHVIAYLIVSSFFGLAITFGIANWTEGEGGNVMSQFWIILPTGMIIGLVLGFFIYCYAAEEARLW